MTMNISCLADVVSVGTRNIYVNNWMRVKHVFELETSHQVGLETLFETSRLFIGVLLISAFESSQPKTSLRVQVSSIKISASAEVKASQSECGKNHHRVHLIQIKKTLSWKSVINFLRLNPVYKWIFLTIS